MNDPTFPKNSNAADQALGLAAGAGGAASGTTKSDIATLKTQVAALQAVTTPYFSSKTFGWYGTSIPAFSLYPGKVAVNLGVSTLTNRAQGGSRVHIRWSGSQTAAAYAGSFHSACSDWSETIAEKQWIIDNYAAVYTHLTDTADPTTPTPTQMANNSVVYISGPHGAVGCQDVVRGWSFEYNLINERLNSSASNYLGPADLIVIDHGYNDQPTQSQYNNAGVLASYGNDSNVDPTVYSTAVAASRDRQTFFTGINYILDQVYRYNPNQRVCFISHYNRYTSTHETSVTMGQWLVLTQEQISWYWGLPFCKVWEKVGINNQVALGSVSKWSLAPWSSFPTSATGYSYNTSADMTDENVWIADRIHPLSTGSTAPLMTIIANIIT